MKEMQTKQLPKKCFWTPGNCTVEVLRTGHFPTTAMVRLPDGREIEVEIGDLK